MKELDMFNLANFREREMELAADLLRSYARAGQNRDGKQYNALPESWCDDGVKLAFNPNSGFVFLSNEESQALVDTEDGIAMWYFTPYYGVEGILGRRGGSIYRRRHRRRRQGASPVGVGQLANR